MNDGPADYTAYQKSFADPKIPTQIWSYVISLIILYPAYFFTGQLTVSNAVLVLFYGMIVALAANGGFDAINKVLSSAVKKE